MSATYPDEVRAKAREIVDRMKSDASFAAQVDQDPQGTLVAAGLPAQAVEDFSVEAANSGEVQGYRGCAVTCDISCAITCIVTSW
jgi:hypothetical protein